MPASISDLPSRGDTPTTTHPDPDTSLIGNLALNPSSTSALRELISIEENDLSAARASLVPALSAVLAAKSRISTLQEQLLSEQFTLQLAQQTADRIQLRISDLKESIRERRGFLHPIRRLPVEVLQEIFIWRIEEEENARRKAVDAASKLVEPGLHGLTSPAPGCWIEFCPVAAALVLTAVCKHWRDVAHDTPRLWRYIYGSLSGQPLPSHHDVWRACQTRVAGLGGINRLNRPLELVLEGWEDGNHPAPAHRIECLMNVLIGHALGLHKAAAAGGGKPRSLVAQDMAAPDESLGVTIANKRSSFTIGRMEISFRRATRALFAEPRQWSVSYPVPQELVLINVNGKNPTEVPPYCSSLFPQVTKLALVGMRYPWPSGVDYSKLKSLSLDTISAQNLNACLQVCNDYLTELELRVEGFGLGILGPVTTLSKLENCTMSLQMMVEYCSALSMPALKKLTLLNLSSRRQNLVRIVQQYADLHMPNVEELRICAGRLSSSTTQADYGASMVASASNLPPDHLANLVDVLSAFNNIVTLHLENLAVRPVLEAWDSLPSTSHHKVWPKLEGLILEGDICPLDVVYLQSARSKRKSLIGGASGPVDPNSVPFTVNAIPVDDFVTAFNRRGGSH